MRQDRLVPDDHAARHHHALQRTTGQPDGVIRDFEDTIFGQDQVVVESQRPERVPFDLAAELHLRLDAVAVAYRKAMRDLGLAASTTIGISAE